MKRERTLKRFFIYLVSLTLLISCADSGSDSDSDSSSGTDADVTFMLAADYGGGSSSIARGLAVSGNDTQTPLDSSVPISLTACLGTESTDSSGYAAGLDCDGDGGAVAYTTPTEFKVAVKRLSFYLSNGTEVKLIDEAATLAESELVDLAQPVQLDISSIPAGTYGSVVIEIYYYDIKMELNQSGNSEDLRIYLSDDDFTAEGSLGHHQGDVLMLAGADSSLGVSSGDYGWVLPGYEWVDNLLAPARSGDFDNDGNTDVIRGASSDDTETGHARGLYGNDDLWNQADYMQGADQDVFVIEASVSITVPETGGTVTITFDLQDSWFFEDFDGNGYFNPCTGNGSLSDGCHDNAEWSPILPGLDIDFTAAQ